MEIELVIRIIGILLALIIVFLIGFWLWSPWVDETYDSWRYYFYGVKYSSKEFYHHVESILESRQMPNVILRRVMFREGIFSFRYREYLRVKNGPYNFDICAAPYGSGFFVSWWFGENFGCLLRILLWLPLIGWYLRTKLKYKTYYVMDSEAMFIQSVKDAFDQVVDDMTKEKGFRPLSERERLSRRDRGSSL